MPYKHYTVYPEEWKNLNVIKQNINNYIVFVHGGTLYYSKPRESYYEILVMNNLKYKIYKETIQNEKLTPNRAMLLGLFSVLNQIPSNQKVVIIIGCQLGFTMAIEREEGVNFDYVYAVLNMIDHKRQTATIYSLLEGSNVIIDIIRNPEKYKLMKE